VRVEGEWKEALEEYKSVLRHRPNAVGEDVRGGRHPADARQSSPWPASGGFHQAVNLGA
jgi:hypothetical protein